MWQSAAGCWLGGNEQRPKTNALKHLHLASSHTPRSGRLCLRAPSPQAPLASEEGTSHLADDGWAETRGELLKAIDEVPRRVVEEMAAVTAVAPLIEADLTTPLAQRVFQTDASEEGFGIVAGEMPKDEVREEAAIPVDPALMREIDIEMMKEEEKEGRGMRIPTNHFAEIYHLNAATAVMHYAFVVPRTIAHHLFPVSYTHLRAHET